MLGKFNMTKSSLLIIRYLSSFLLLAIVIQILLGAWVRLTGSGLSCPDWPLCYGFFFLNLNLKPRIKIGLLKEDQ